MKKDIVIILKLIGISILGFCGLVGVRVLGGLIRSTTASFYIPIQTIIAILFLVWSICLFSNWYANKLPKDPNEKS